MSGCGVCGCYVSDLVRAKKQNDFLRCSTCPRWLHKLCEGKATRIGDLTICSACSQARPKDEAAKMALITQHLYTEMVQLHKTQRRSNSEILDVLCDIKESIASRDSDGSRNNDENTENFLERIFQAFQAQTNMLADRFDAQNKLMAGCVSQCTLLAKSFAAQNKLLVESIATQNKMAAESVAAQNRMVAAQKEMAAAQNKMTTGLLNIVTGQDRVFGALERLNIKTDVGDVASDTNCTAGQLKHIQVQFANLLSNLQNN